MTRKTYTIQDLINRACTEADGSFNLLMGEYKGSRSWLEARKQIGLERVTFYYRNKPITQNHAESLLAVYNAVHAEEVQS
jgi:hypothetical protein